MAADVFLARHAHRTGQVVLRLYAWSIPTLSLGFHQRIAAEQSARCRDRSVPIVRRPTGGRAVLHDRELTYAITVPADHVLLKAGRDTILHEVGSAFITAARRLGLNAELMRVGRWEGPSQTLHRGSPLCFDSVSRWEVRLNGRKWIGSAQRLLPEAFLQHGSILTGAGRVDLAQLLGLPTTSECIGGEKISETDLRHAIPIALAERWNITWQECGFDPNELNEINRLIEERQQDETHPRHPHSDTVGRHRSTRCG